MSRSGHLLRSPGLAMPKQEIVEYNGKVGYWTKGRSHRGNFVPLTNFCLRLLQYIRVPDTLTKESGFLVEVKQTINGRSTVGYMHTIADDAVCFTHCIADKLTYHGTRCQIVISW